MPKVIEQVARHLTIDQTSHALWELCYFERASAHILAGWIAKICELDVKFALGRHLSQDMHHAAQLRRRFDNLNDLAGGSHHVPSGWQSVMVAVDQASDTRNLLVGLYEVIKGHLHELSTHYLANADPVADAHTVALVRVIDSDNSERREWAKQAANSLPHNHDSNQFQKYIDELWRHRSTEDCVDSEHALWSPLDRVPQVGRAQNLRRGEPGALRLVPADPFRNPKDIGIFLHNFLNEEISTLELVSRNSYEHPGMPSKFHLDMARQAGDEARHALLLQELAAQYGVTYGDYPVYVSSYEAQYQFQACEPGGRRELLWRILLRQAFHEGLALDSLAFEVRKRDFLGQPEMARIFGFLLSDEVFHAQSGLCWSRYLCDSEKKSATEEMAAAHEYFVERVKRARARFVADHMDKAIAEVEMLDCIAENLPALPFEREINVRAREQAGYTPEEVQQVIDWGYARH
ncbi:ferritin-like domain-containing protein [Streptomyces sp. LX-29]|uniref:DUF455 family protein n=1 Tax=Streptomyces sp. LX-29 TaxID=2900152 RepID=UPI00240D3834|nr:DUF455 family protein [Streptomyces sp. LX-29]WFB10909.1 ferritin-like domain-containing protein [Streptomyces sp. LX-29]